VERVSAHFVDPAYQALPAHPAALEDNLKQTPAFARWVQRNVRGHQHAGYAAVTLSLKRASVAPGDATADEMDAVARLADAYSFGELRVTHEQNLVLPDVPRTQLFALWQEAKALGFANPTIGLLTDLIACPGGDFCSLANARSLPIAEAILQRFDDLDYLYDLGEITLNISGCINSCGHHHNGNIGILGVDKDDKEFYQISLGGRYGVGEGNDTRVGRIIGPSFAAHQVVGVIERMLSVYANQRQDGEAFVDCVDRLGIEPFKHAAYTNLEDAEQQNIKQQEASHA
jgi:sulfite reductase (NADPH) hemoprotein beta-component